MEFYATLSRKICYMVQIPRHTNQFMRWEKNIFRADNNVILQKTYVLFTMLKQHKLGLKRILYES